ncbi:hypothetical protein ASF63_15880 [Microbacterium sp. Leaf320]|nr:hypothetical protein ASF63_15880 [Microbacterium sp. Leaf320]
MTHELLPFFRRSFALANLDTTSSALETDSQGAICDQRVQHSIRNVGQKSIQLPKPKLASKSLDRRARHSNVAISELRANDLRLESGEQQHWLATVDRWDRLKLGCYMVAHSTILLQLVSGAGKRNGHQAND